MGHSRAGGSPAILGTSSLLRSYCNQCSWDPLELGRASWWTEMVCAADGALQVDHKAEEPTHLGLGGDRGNTAA